MAGSNKLRKLLNPKILAQWGSLLSELQSAGDKVPEGYLSVYDLCGKTPASTMIDRLERLERDGLIESKLFKIKHGGKLREMRFYKPISRPDQCGSTQRTQN